MEHKKHEDRRITRTRSALLRAFMELINEKGYDAITIEDITQRANLGRTTFYLHYENKEALLLEQVEQRLAGLMEEMAAYPAEFWFQENNHNGFYSVFQIVRENADIFKNLHGEQSFRIFESFRNMIFKIATELIQRNAYVQKRAAELHLPVELVADYFSGAICASIGWWVRNNFAPSNEEMTGYFRNLFLPGFQKAFQPSKMS